MDVRLPEPMLAATFSYKFKFSRDYSWTSGGKLPGVCAEGVPACLPIRARARQLSESAAQVCTLCRATAHIEG